MWAAPQKPIAYKFLKRLARKGFRTNFQFVNCESVYTPFINFLSFIHALCFCSVVFWIALQESFYLCASQLGILSWDTFIIIINLLGLPRRLKNNPNGKQEAIGLFFVSCWSFGCQEIVAPVVWRWSFRVNFSTAAVGNAFLLPSLVFVKLLPFGLVFWVNVIVHSLLWNLFWIYVISYCCFS